jgi:hypothetical protein
MKKIIFVLALTLCTGALFAQTGDTSMHSKWKMHKMQDCYYMHNGTMMQFIGGQKSALTENKTLANGTVVMTNGTVKMSDGTTKTLQNDECIDMSGKTMMMHPHHAMKGNMSDSTMKM